MQEKAKSSTALRATRDDLKITFALWSSDHIPPSTSHAGDPISIPESGNFTMWARGEPASHIRLMAQTHGVSWGRTTVLRSCPIPVILMKG
ncbi:hypothetical protein IG631_20753 [Alternaria alternata]|nr:hypothetical protein IG631_20753 [Alternaria alternata]